MTIEQDLRTLDQIAAVCRPKDADALRRIADYVQGRIGFDTDKYLYFPVNKAEFSKWYKENYRIDFDCRTSLNTGMIVQCYIALHQIEQIRERDQEISELRRQVLSYESIVADRDERIAEMEKQLSSSTQDDSDEPTDEMLRAAMLVHAMIPDERTFEEHQNSYRMIYKAMRSLAPAVVGMQLVPVDCAEFLRSGETVCERLKREHEDLIGVLGLLADERRKQEMLDGIESGWLIEKGSPSEPQYAYFVDGILSWTNPGDHESAFRMSRRIDAEALAELMEDSERIADHEWVVDEAVRGES